MSRLVVYTDGACKSAPRPKGFKVNKNGKRLPILESRGMGGWAWWTEEYQFDSGALDQTTNNAMELLAVIQAILTMRTHVPERDLLIVTDSAYVVNCFKDHWYESWLDNDWHTSSGKPVKNKDYWERLIDLVMTHPSAITFRHCRGHGRGGPEDAPYVYGNHQADRLAVAARLTLEK